MKKFVFAISIILMWTVSLIAQTTAFNFQGRLNDGGNPANGRYDLQFKLFDALNGGTQIASIPPKLNTQVIDGVFSTVLDFGSTAFASDVRFLEIGVRPAGSANVFVILGQRQQLLAVPFAVRASSADTAYRADLAGLADNSGRLGSLPPSSYAVLNGTNNNGDLAITGAIQPGGNAIQPNTSNGLPKAMLAITAGRAIARCYNGVTGNGTGTCGFSVAAPGFIVTFPFRVSDRFWLAVPDATGSPGIGVRVANIEPLGDFQLVVYTYSDGTPTLLPFHLFVF